MIWFFFFLSLQECLEKCGESLQEIINYHMVSRPCTPPRTARWYHPDWLLKASRGPSIPSRTILRVRTELGLHVDFFSHTSLKSVCVTVSQSGDHISKPQRTRKTHDAVFSRAPFRPASLNSESDESSTFQNKNPVFVLPLFCYVKVTIGFLRGSMSSHFRLFFSVAELWI